ncbi:MAG: VanZ family protein [Candidatus Omnitrophica bacterium]|nr:VanZ family protein [Candidatus Omnitrophota bacterium]
MLKLFFKYWLPVLLYAILIFSISSIPGPELPQNLILSDYLLHILEYLPFGFLMFRAIRNTRSNFTLRKIFISSAILVILYAASDELHQLFIPGRYASLLDLLCDGIGAAIGARIAI